MRRKLFALADSGVCQFPALPPSAGRVRFEQTWPSAGRFMTRPRLATAKGDDSEADRKTSHQSCLLDSDIGQCVQ
jgi:hypothetical protein